MSEHYQPYHPGLKRLSGTAAQQRTALDVPSNGELTDAIAAISEDIDGGSATTVYDEDDIIDGGAAT